MPKYQNKSQILAHNILLLGLNSADGGDDNSRLKQLHQLIATYSAKAGDDDITPEQLIKELGLETVNRPTKKQVAPQDFLIRPDTFPLAHLRKLAAMKSNPYSDLWRALISTMPVPKVTVEEKIKVYLQLAAAVLNGEFCPKNKYPLAMTLIQSAYRFAKTDEQLANIAAEINTTSIRNRFESKDNRTGSTYELQLNQLARKKIGDAISTETPSSKKYATRQGKALSRALLSLTLDHVEGIMNDEEYNTQFNRLISNYFSTNTRFQSRNSQREAIMKKVLGLTQTNTRIDPAQFPLERLQQLAINQEIFGGFWLVLKSSMPIPQISVDEKIETYLRLLLELVRGSLGKDNHYHLAKRLINAACAIATTPEQLQKINRKIMGDKMGLDPYYQYNMLSWIAHFGQETSGINTDYQQEVAQLETTIYDKSAALFQDKYKDLPKEIKPVCAVPFGEESFESWSSQPEVQTQLPPLDEFVFPPLIDPAQLTSEPLVNPVQPTPEPLVNPVKKPVAPNNPIESINPKPIASTPTVIVQPTVSTSPTLTLQDVMDALKRHFGKTIDNIPYTGVRHMMRLMTQNNDTTTLSQELHRIAKQRQHRYFSKIRLFHTGRDMNRVQPLYDLMAQDNFQLNQDTMTSIMSIMEPPFVTVKSREENTHALLATFNSLLIQHFGVKGEKTNSTGVKNMLRAMSIITYPNVLVSLIKNIAKEREQIGFRTGLSNLRLTFLAPGRHKKVQSLYYLLSQPNFCLNEYTLDKIKAALEERSQQSSYPSTPSPSPMK